MQSGFPVPILFTIFNRLGTTRVVFDEIRKVRPQKLFIVADGPREGRTGEKEKCEETRKITEQIDWECEVHRNYADVNLGYTKRTESGISWFFDHVVEGIVLEDDDLPHLDFFSYCQEMLERYRDDDRVMVIGGDNFQGGKKWGDASYYFSAFFHVWGYATWKRAWGKYDATLEGITFESFDDTLRYYFSYAPQRKFWERYFKRAKARGAAATCDAKFTFSIWHHRGLSVIPNVNLVSNIGAGDGATHTQDIDSNCSNLLTHGILPINHLGEVVLCREADARFYKLCTPTFFKKIIRKISRVMNA